jgi:hypothetical protein
MPGPDLSAGDDAARATGDPAAGPLELAGATVGRQTLSEMRGGFVEVDGRRIDFNIELQTFLNGVEQLRSVVTLDNLLNGQGGTVLSGGQQAAATSATRIANGATGATRVTHSLAPSDLGATVVNSQSGVDVRNLGKIAIEVVNPNNRRSGRPFNAGRGLSLEQERAQRSAIAR